ncbi:serine hydrolase [bacterium SCSIO 12741]|nr:serine hydrolase [bacterium SCSIO 12741]
MDQKVSEFLPDFQGLPEGETTIRDLLKMSSGINFDEHYVNPFAYPARANYGDDLVGLTMSYQQTEKPANTFSYLSGNTQLLSMIVREATGMSVSEYFSSRIWQPVGAKNTALWSMDHEDGYEKAFCCFNSNALDFARIGKLYLQQGVWMGDTLIDPAYVMESTHPVGMKEKDGSDCTRYGYQWWLTDFEGKPVFYARGILGQYILVCPDMDLIVVRLGHKRIKPQGYEPPEEIEKYLKSAQRIISAK